MFSKLNIGTRFALEEQSRELASAVGAFRLHA
jgi:hypothetical protein